MKSSYTAPSTFDQTTVFVPSEDIVVREIEGELILVPIAAGVGDAEDAIFTFNDTGREIWQRLDGKRTIQQVIVELQALYDAPAGGIAEDVSGLVSELLRRNMLAQK